MRNALIVVAAAVTLASQVSGQEQAAAPVPAPPRIEITFEGNGVMSLVANNAPLRDILNEWTRKGGTPFVGTERLTGSPLTLQFTHESETEVLKSLLRNVSGYVASARQASSPAPSGLEVVYLLPTSNATASGFSPAPAYVAPPPPPTTTGNVDSEVPPAGPGRGGQTSGAPAQEPAPSYPRPAGVSGVAVPVITVPVSGSTPPATTGTTTTTGTGPGRGGGAGR